MVWVTDGGALQNEDWVKFKRVKKPSNATDLFVGQPVLLSMQKARGQFFPSSRPVASIYLRGYSAYNCDPYDLPQKLQFPTL